MRVFPPRHHHHHHQDVDALRWNKKSQKIAKKMAKLEQKLCKYIAASGETANDSSRDSSRCRSRSRSRGCRSRSRSRDAERRRMCRRHRRHGKRFASHGGSSSSSSSESSSDSGSSRASSVSRSPSPPPSLPPSGQRRRAPVQGRSRPRREHRSRRHRDHWSCHRRCSDHEGFRACLYRLLSLSEPNLPAAQDPESSGKEGDETRAGLETNGVCIDADQPAGQTHMDEDFRSANEEAEERPELDASLASHWKKIVVEGLSAEAKAALLKKYSVSDSRQILKAPKINPEILPVATEATIKNDCILLCEQSQIGSGLAALSQAIANLSGNEEIRKNEEAAEALGKLNDAADIFLNAHHELSRARQLIMIPGLKKGAKIAVENCNPDDLLFGRDFGEKVKDVKCFKKSKKYSKSHKSESKTEAGKKRKHTHHEGERRTSKRLDLSGLSIKSS